MPPQRRVDNCRQPECLALRQRYGQMCAARACAQRELERLEAEMALQRMRHGDGRMGPNQRRVEPGGDAATRRENVHILKERIRAVRALIEKINSDPDPESDVVLKAIEARIESIEAQLNTEEGDIGPLVDSYQKLQTAASKHRIETQPLDCAICLEDIQPNTHMMGKNCTHLFCMNCVAQTAFSQVKPAHQVDDNPYWEHVGYHEDLGPNGLGVAHQYRVRPEHFEEDGVTYKTFPANVWVRCPSCRDDHYCNASYFDMCKQAMATIDENDSMPQALKQPKDIVDEMVAGDLLLCLDAPKAEGYVGPDLVLVVEAKIPGTPDIGNFPRGPQLGAQLRMLGYSWDRGEKTGGNGWVCEKRSDHTVHPRNYRSGQLLKTAPQRKRKMIDIEPSPEGVRRMEEQKVLQGGGTWKFAYPRPPPAVDNNAEAGPSGEAPSPMNAYGAQDVHAEMPETDDEPLL